LSINIHFSQTAATLPSPLFPVNKALFITTLRTLCFHSIQRRTHRNLFLCIRVQYFISKREKKYLIKPRLPHILVCAFQSWKKFTAETFVVRIHHHHFITFPWFEYFLSLRRFRKELFNTALLLRVKCRRDVALIFILKPIRNRV